MAQANTIKSLGARNMSCIVERMEWNNKMDLIAYGTDKGEVVIQRLNWQKIVKFPTPGDDVRVRSLSWQTDETLLAVGYSNGKVALLDAESEIMISGLIYEDDIKKVYFTKAIKQQHTLETYNTTTQDCHKRFLPKLPTLTNIDPTIKPIGHKSFPKGSPCFLIVIMNSGKVHLLLLGALQSGCIDLTQHIINPTHFGVYDVRFNGDFNAVYALLRDGNELKVLYFHNQILQQCMSPLLQLALHCANILETKNYINDTQQCIVEAWETVLLEMDNKLTKYTGSQPSGLISTYFLELFLFGVTNAEFESFLTDELTEKGFKKIANSVDLSLSNLQALVSNQLNSAGIYMFFFLNMTNGYSRATHFFEPLISTDAATEAVRECGAFILKIKELKYMIKAIENEIDLFHSWMCVPLLRLQHQDIPEHMQLAPLESYLLAEYFYTMEDHFSNNEISNGIPRNIYNIERIGQYLENEELTQLPKTPTHHVWSEMINENECIRDCSHIIPHDQRLSLIQQRDKMLNAIDALFRKPTESISASFRLSTRIICGILPDFETELDDFVNCTYFVNDAGKSDMMAVTINWQEVMILEFCRQIDIFRCMRINLQSLPPISAYLNTDYNNLRFIDIQFYNENALSLLTQTFNHERPRSYFVQCSLINAKSHSTQHPMAPIINLMDISETHSIHEYNDGVIFKQLDGICEMLAVSGSRKVATILSDRKRKMTIFEMETEEEDDDAEMTQSTSILEMSKESVCRTEQE